MAIDRQKLVGLGWQALAYVLAVTIAIWFFLQTGSVDLIWRILIADIAATLVIFGFSRTFDNSSFYDPYWSLQPIVIAFGLYIGFEPILSVQRGALVLILITLYGLRLTYNFYRTWPGLHHQDWRYDDLQRKNGKAYWWVSFSGIHMLPTLLVFGGCLAMVAIYTDPVQGLNWIDGVATAVLLAGITIEYRADQELHNYRATARPGGLLESGLWAQMRHPNYLGEILVWWGLYLFGLAANPSYWWTIVGPLSIFLLFVFISIPMKDERMLKSRPEYKRRMQEVPALWPRQFRFK